MSAELGRIVGHVDHLQQGIPPDHDDLLCVVCGKYGTDSARWLGDRYEHYHAKPCLERTLRQSRIALTDEMHAINNLCGPISRGVVERNFERMHQESDLSATQPVEEVSRHELPKIPRAPRSRRR